VHVVLTVPRRGPGRETNRERLHVGEAAVGISDPPRGGTTRGLLEASGVGVDVSAKRLEVRDERARVGTQRCSVGNSKCVTESDQSSWRRWRRGDSK
jgi:hypothetical protein